MMPILCVAKISFTEHASLKSLDDRGKLADAGGDRLEALLGFLVQGVFLSRLISSVLAEIMA
jgi:hypothetical protein